MAIDTKNITTGVDTTQWDTGSNDDFYKYYEQQSLSPQTMERFRLTTLMLLRLLGSSDATRKLDVLDVGCGAGTQSRFWLERGHRYWGIDINRPLIELAQRRVAQQGLDAGFEVGSATVLPYADASMDVCLLPELLEHVEDWKACVDEAARVLRPRGIMYINTSSRLCPKQQEFTLPLYSWYPGPLKKYFERRAVTDWPALANHAKYPAVNWFSFYQLRDYLAPLGFESLDRFDIMDTDDKGAAVRAVVSAVRGAPPLRFVGQVLTPYTLLVGRKSAAKP